MLFNSYEFILFFLPVTFVVYFWLNQRRLITAGKSWLALASLAFYSWWGLAYLPLILTSIVVNYGIGTALGVDTVNYRGRKVLSRKLILATGIVFNLGVLGYFKYANFLLDNINIATGSTFYSPKIALPLAISFFTFQKIAYLVDSYKNETRDYDFLNYVLFVTFFPQLIAGPIVHHKEIIPQFRNKWNLNKRWRNINLGLIVFSLGLFKKVIIADTFARWATPGFDTATTLNFFDAWVTSLSYTFQLYFDFSGYTDMAIGAALLFNIRLPINFNSPYKASNIQDFWRRWHITLSNFLRDYLYIPLGGSKNGEVRTYINLFATFLLGGLWHGASWMFVVWGMLHGSALIINRLWSRTGMKMPVALGWFITFFFVNLAWVFFRAKDMGAAYKVISGMFGIESHGIKSILLDKYVLLTEHVSTITDLSAALANGINKDLQILLMISIAFAMTLLTRNTLAFCSGNKESRLVNVSAGVIFGAVLVTMFSSSARVSEFLYFSF